MKMINVDDTSYETLNFVSTNVTPTNEYLDLHLHDYMNASIANERTTQPTNHHYHHDPKIIIAVQCIV